MDKNRLADRPKPNPIWCYACTHFDVCRVARLATKLALAASSVWVTKGTGQFEGELWVSLAEGCRYWELSGWAKREYSKEQADTEAANG